MAINEQTSKIIQMHNLGFVELFAHDFFGCHYFVWA